MKLDKVLIPRGRFGDGTKDSNHNLLTRQIHYDKLSAVAPGTNLRIVEKYIIPT